MKDYAMYKGEDILAIGTIAEIAKHLSVKESTVKFYGTPSYQKRIRGDKAKILIELEDD